ncbi:NAD(P)-dependent oxidoreductase [Budvicia aquatica]|uniref:NAD(P)-dependent oxidoreductase n=1 Tax=Budvicia aquatica TaxID=82979 RepID=UPI001D0E9041|nr:hypothetical protein [Budvicia aquatica]
MDAFSASPGHEKDHQTSLAHLADILSGNQQTRLLVVGGAGSLYVDEQLTLQVIDTPDFPDAYKPTASNMRDAYLALKTRNDVNWTYFSPSAMFIPMHHAPELHAGQRPLADQFSRRKYHRLCDYATAMVDESNRVNIFVNVLPPLRVNPIFRSDYRF